MTLWSKGGGGIQHKDTQSAKCHTKQIDNSTAITASGPLLMATPEEGRLQYKARSQMNSLCTKQPLNTAHPLYKGHNFVPNIHVICTAAIVKTSSIDTERN